MSLILQKSIQIEKQGGNFKWTSQWYTDGFKTRPKLTQLMKNQDHHKRSQNLAVGESQYCLLLKISSWKKLHMSESNSITSPPN